MPRRLRVRDPHGADRLPATPAARRSTSRCSRTRPTTPAGASARWSSTRAVRARPARRTPRTPPSRSASALRERLRHRRLRPARHRRLRPGRLPLRPASSTHFLAADPDPDTPEEGADYQANLEAFYQGCVDNSDSLIGHVTTIEAARDMDVLRAALGEAQLLYFGASYGTKLGATYADLFPDKVGRMVLDGAVDLSIDSRQLSLQQAGGFEVALRRLRPELRRRGRLLPRRHPRRGADHDPGPDREHRGAAAPASGSRPGARGRQRLLRPGRAALQPRLLVDPRPGARARPRR